MLSHIYVSAGCQLCIYTYERCFVHILFLSFFFFPNMLEFILLISLVLQYMYHILLQLLQELYTTEQQTTSGKPDINEHKLAISSARLWIYLNFCEVSFAKNKSNPVVSYMEALNAYLSFFFTNSLAVNYITLSTRR